MDRPRRIALKNFKPSTCCFVHAKLNSSFVRLSSGDDVEKPSELFDSIERLHDEINMEDND